MIYLDTSAIVPLIVHETTSSRARSWRDNLDARQLQRLAISEWTRTEFTSAIGSKVRNRNLTRREGEAALALLEQSVLPNVMLVAATVTDFRLAEIILREFSLGLCAGDALHLATASRCAVELFVALDRTLARAATALGIPVARI